MVKEMIDGTFRQTNLRNESVEYLAKREEVRLAEIELMRARERVAELRRALPKGAEIRDYEFFEGPTSLADGDEPVNKVHLSGGVAIHGSRNVPNEPASHGCIRIPMFAAREVSSLLKLGTIVLVYDKVSFVSARDWVKNPKLKEAALANIAMDDEIAIDAPAVKGRSLGIRRSRPRLVRS